MSPILQAAKRQKVKIHRFSAAVKLEDGASTTVHVVRYDRRAFYPRIIAFPQETLLTDWCNQSGAKEALSGGFFLRSTARILGDIWIDGIRRDSTSIPGPWNKSRGSLHIDSQGRIALGARQSFPDIPENSLLQAGPVLVRDGKPQIIEEKENEGISAVNHQFDTDITIGRYPRAAIGTDSRYIWSVACDGRSRNDAGMTLTELMNSMLTLGAIDALNLDGGSSATQISNGALRNRPRGDDREYIMGRPVHTAIIFN